MREHYETLIIEKRTYLQERRLEITRTREVTDQKCNKINEKNVKITQEIKLLEASEVDS